MYVELRLYSSSSPGLISNSLSFVPFALSHFLKPTTGLTRCWAAFFSPLSRLACGRIILILAPLRRPFPHAETPCPLLPPPKPPPNPLPSTSRRLRCQAAWTHDTTAPRPRGEAATPTLQGPRRAPSPTPITTPRTRAMAVPARRAPASTVLEHPTTRPTIRPPPRPLPTPAASSTTRTQDAHDATPTT